MHEQIFKRAKSTQNKKIRFQQIMDQTDQLFHTYSYHDITLTLIAKTLGLARGGLYKYTATKEEIFLAIYLQKQAGFLEDIMKSLPEQTVTVTSFSNCFSDTLFKHLDFLKYHQILNAIIETNVSVERLAEFKLASNRQQRPLFAFWEAHFKLSHEEAFDLYLTILYHAVYLYDRVAYSDKYRQAMQLAGLHINEIDFSEKLNAFIELHLRKQNKNTAHTIQSTHP